jgi:hypothetical protein
MEISAMFSPLQPIFEASEAPVPAAFRAQFLHSVDDPSKIVLEGVLHHVWHRPGWLRPLFQFLGQLHILVPDTGVEIPTTLEVITSRLVDGRPIHVWRRAMHFTTVRLFPTTIVYDAGRDRVVDLVGPGNALHMVWRAKFRPPVTFTLDTDACGIYLMGRVRWFPRWFWPWLLGTVRFVQRAGSFDSNRVDIEIVIRHPLLGDVFGYDGTFSVRRYEN